MAQRTAWGTTNADSDMAGSIRCPANSREVEEGQPIPTRARHLSCNGAQRTIPATLILETIDEHLYGDSVAPILPFQHGAGSRNAPVEAHRRAGRHHRNYSIADLQE